MTTSVSTGLPVIDVTDLRLLATQLKAADPESAAQLRVGLRAAGQLVADEAKARASWSTKIPGSVSVSTYGVGVKVKAGGPKAPMAKAFEHGGVAGTFNHPVYGNATGGKATGPWVKQNARPFLGPALAAKGQDVETAVIDSLRGGLRALGLDLS